MRKATKRETPKPPRWSPIEGAATYMNVNPMTIRRMIRQGKLKAYRGAGERLTRIDLNELDALVKGHE
jgi:excisionase family DNA binding protein